MRRRQSLEAGAGRGALHGPAHRMQFWDRTRGAQLAVGTCSRPQTAEQRLLLLATVGPGCATEPTTLQGSTSGTGGMRLGEDRSPGWPQARLREMAGDQRGCTRGPSPPACRAPRSLGCMAISVSGPGHTYPTRMLQGQGAGEGRGPAELCQRPGRVPGTAQCPGGLRLQTPTTASSYAATLKTGRSQDGFLSGFCSARSRQTPAGPTSASGNTSPSRVGWPGTWG